MSAGWENVSRQASPFQGRKPPPSRRRRRGERRSNEDHLSLQTAALVLRRCLGWLSRVLLLIVLLCVLLRAAVDVLLGSLLCVLGSIILLTPPGGEVFLIPDSGLEGDDVLVSFHSP